MCGNNILYWNFHWPPIRLEYESKNLVELQEHEYNKVLRQLCTHRCWHPQVMLILFQMDGVAGFLPWCLFTDLIWFIIYICYYFIPFDMFWISYVFILFSTFSCILSEWRHGSCLLYNHFIWYISIARKIYIF